RGSEEDGRSNPIPPRRRRSNRADCRLSHACSQARQERNAKSLQGRAARLVHDSQGPGQCGSTCVHQKLTRITGIAVKPTGSFMSASDSSGMVGGAECGIEKSSKSSMTRNTI